MPVVSVTVEKRIVPRGDDEYLQAAWNLKEEIREREDLLKQRWRFFSDAYRRATVHAFVTGVDDLVGFAAARRDGYILFLAVSPDHRGEGYGERLVASVAEEADTVSCHARASNQNALEFYKHLGFEVERSIDNYYEDGGAAHYLRLGDSGKLRDRLSEFFRR